MQTEGKEPTQGYETRNRDMDIVELAATVFRERRTIAIFVASFFIAGAIFTKMSPTKFIGSVEIHKLTDYELSEFALWNKLVTPVQQIPKTSINSDLKPVLSTGLVEQFKQKFVRLDAIRMALMTHSKELEGHSGNSQEKAILASSLARNYRIETTKFGTDQITFFTSDRDASIAVLNHAITDILRGLNEENLNSMSASLEAATRARDFEISSIDAERRGAIAYYQSQKQRSIKLLKEQAHIARKLDVKMPAFEVLNQNPNPLVNLYSENSELIYLHGYMAIEEQIWILENRSGKDDVLLADGISELAFRDAEIKASDRIEQLKAILRHLPFNDASFASVKVDLDQVRFEPQSNNLLIFLAWISTGVILGTVFVSLKNALRQRQRNLSNI